MRVCKFCGWEVDDDVCWCGIELESHNSYHTGHMFIPMGCTCGYNDADQRKKPKELL